ncbi:hypothetical protein R50073_12940 [Maricurvus nonylphenolicus]|uniref:hypothetical protein n=1 Tax=Maricurvus nonylphenolicus TaxID=1008307 RepID=UPI0036F2BE70
MLELIQSTLGPYYLTIKWVHLFFAITWIMSVAGAYSYFLVPVVQQWRKNPHDEGAIRMRNWAFERFDQAVVYEHTAFPMFLITGILLVLVGGWTTSAGWLVLKLSIVFVVILPMEAVDYYISHFGGNKRRMRDRGDDVAYEKAIHHHWWFFLVTSPPVAVFALIITYLAVLKPF